MSEYVIAKYIRLSRDDAVSDSLSIPNQHALLDKFILQMEMRGTKTLDFVDNGYTGTNFERPAVQEMLELVRNGKIQCILCKDFSRLGRNILETGYFVEQVFPLYGVRFIAVTDGYDSDDYKGDTGGIDVAFKFLIHEYYSKDLSRKVKSAKHIKMINGEIITANAVYGYYKAKNGKWEIDSCAAEVIRLIFKMALDGVTLSQIRNSLCAAGHPIPSEHKALRRGRQIIPSCLWSNAMVSSILRNEQYTGTYIAGMTERRIVGSNQQMEVDKSEWIRLPDRHPAIISREEFDAAQEKYAKRKNSKTRTAREYLLQRKVFCGCCQRALSYSQKAKPTFQCVHTIANPNAECYKMKVSARELEGAVVSVIRKQAEIVLNNGDISELRKMSAGEQQISECEKQIRICEEQRQRSYEQFILREIDRDAFQIIKNECAKQIDRLNNSLTLLKQAERGKEEKQKIAALAKKALNESSPLREVIEALVDKILVSPGNRIEIQWRFTDFTASV